MQRRVIGGLVGLSLVATSVIGAGAAFGSDGASPPVAPESGQAKSDNLPNPLADKQSALRQSAVTGVLDGDLKTQKINGSTVVKVGETVADNADAAASASAQKLGAPASAQAKADAKAAKKAKAGAATKKSQYVELSREKTDKIFVILAEFGNERHPDFPDEDTDPDTPGPIRFDGPLHNEIPEPDRTKDNSTVWQPDFDQPHFQDLYFGKGDSLKNYYEEQSSGRYSVNGEVTDWVKVPYNEARYGRTDQGAWALVADASKAWYQEQIDAGRSKASVEAELESYDQWDRYDVDGDGNFNEPDGYIDHFQIVHAGGDEADGDPTYGEDAIWSHRWYAYNVYPGQGGADGSDLGGTQIGDSDIWIGDYTVQPENGGRSVFAHEYGHDLGLPDDYDTAGGTNSNEWWTLMAQSRLRSATDAGIGERAGDIGAWNKLQLGWLDYEVVPAGNTRTLKLGPQEYNTTDAQAAVVVLPKKKVTTQLGAPATGTKQFYSGTGDDLDVSMSRSVDVPATAATLSFQARYDIEKGYDYALVEVDSGSGFTPLPTSASTVKQNNGIDGTSDGWDTVTADLSAYAGTTVDLRFRYVTDGGAAGNVQSLPDGFFVDDITLGGLAEGAEDGGATWSFDGFSVVGASTTADFSNYYVAGQRDYVKHDQYLKTGPYDFGYGAAAPDKVDNFAYQDGLLVSYWDTSVADNNTSVHPGSGRNLIIDAHPQPFYQLTTGQPFRGRVQVYDATFGLDKADSMTLHVNGAPNYVRGQAAAPTFDDTKQFWYPELPGIGVKLPAAGVKIKVLQDEGTSMKIKVS
ncbi:immune inhibitor A domain-containing protein [Cellulomonas sp. PhB143]|uniref:immune inhibitor A domain-containing protein n=1 Tax=Cellulomonas sp. PhB143 TaxID=2485186 RepID=UPI000F9A43FF|nr:immune inhibitor A domain-containing protein [Cellulomonas sp. PhB143]ROS75274.1 immune inhibitor A [Cellulomonas sp. PhB143]